jgi:predicted dehydrogenase
VGSAWAATWDEAVRERRFDACIVATPHRFLSPMTIAAVRSGCDVLCEKPLGRNPAEAAEAVAAAREHHRILGTGFNLRHHWAIEAAHAAVVGGEIGSVIFARCRYGHGGRAGYEREWRGDPEAAGGGELVDQGVHVLDLFRWFLGEPVRVQGLVATAFWPVAPLEDNAFALLQTAAGVTAEMHVSWTQWRNLFSLEVFGRDGYAIVEGLGGSYGPETLRLGRRQEGVPPTETSVVAPAGHDPWAVEWDEFVAAVRERRAPLASGEDGLRALELAYEIYRVARPEA